MRSILTVFILLATVSLNYGQNQTDTLEYNLSSPYETVLTHLKYLQTDNYYPSISSKALNPADQNNERLSKLAVKLKQIFDGNGIYIELEDIPREANFLDSVSNKRRYIISAKLPDIYVEKVGNRWLYSTKTV
ncbi:MAG: mechanosensitive ion channel family protein, partial [Fulvivirga sp.]